MKEIQESTEDKERAKQLNPAELKFDFKKYGLATRAETVCITNFILILILL